MDQGRLAATEQHLGATPKVAEAVAQDFNKGVEAVVRPMPDPAERVKLHLGCGAKKLEGFINVDKYGEPDQRVDLERFPWPWMTSVADEVVLVHVLEHLGALPDTRRQIIQELYRVCAPGAKVKIVVPHFRHPNFTGDPTHCWAFNDQQASLLDRNLVEQWQAAGYSNSPLALHWGVNFRQVSCKFNLDEPYNTMFAENQVTAQELHQMAREFNGVIAEIDLVLEAVK